MYNIIKIELTHIIKNIPIRILKLIEEGQVLLNSICVLVIFIDKTPSNFYIIQKIMMKSQEYQNLVINIYFYLFVKFI